MDSDPFASSGDAPNESPSTVRHDRLNSAVAITVALLATFAGLCKVKDDNIVQAMQQAQADKLDHWAYYRARNLREEIAEATAMELEAASQGQPAGKRAFFVVALVATALGVLMGAAGLAGWRLHPDAIARLLS